MDDPVRRARGRVGFTLIELLAVVAIIALLIGLVLPGLMAARRAGRAAVCSANLQQFGVATASYAASFDGDIFSLTWRKGDARSRFPELNNSGATKLALGRQAVDILRTKGGRPDMPDVAQEALDAGSSWSPTIFYSHLVLADFMGGLPAEHAACPEHRDLLNAQRGLISGGVDLDFDGLFDPESPDDIPAGDPEDPDAPQPRFKAHLPYQSSYELVPAAYDPLQSAQPFVGPQHPVARGRIRNAAWTASVWAYSGYLFPHDGELFAATPRGQAIGGVPMSAVRFPAQKVQMYDWFDRHSRDQKRYYTTPGAAQPMLFFDASVRTLAVDEANEGWQPGRPEWDFDTSTQINGALTPMRFRWTRGGLQGVDYGGSPLRQARRSTR